MDIQITKSLEGTKYITPIGLFYKNWGFYLGVSDCEELVGSVTGDDGVGFRELLTVPLPFPHFPMIIFSLS